MRILNIGSLNLDRTYAVRNFVTPGETISALDYQTHCGGKGLNQSLALARAGASVTHLGTIGYDGEILRKTLVEAGVDVSFLRQSQLPNGHAIIQVDKSGQNCIIVYPGSNSDVSKEQIDAGIQTMSSGDWVLLQNETANVAYSIKSAAERGLKIVLNPSPVNQELLNSDLQAVDLFILNETEAQLLSAIKCTDPKILLTHLREMYPHSDFLLTFGEQGAYYQGREKTAQIIVQAAYRVNVVDTTAAGDTFTGYFLAAMMKQMNVPLAMQQASVAAAIAVSRPGAQSSIPLLTEVKDFVAKNRGNL